MVNPEDLQSLLTAIIAIVLVALAISYLKTFLGGNPPEARANIQNLDINYQRDQHRNVHPSIIAPTTTPTTAGPTSGPSSSIRTITISAPGVLLQETQPEALSEGATALSDAISALLSTFSNSNSSKTSSSIQVFLLCHVNDDVGEAVVRAALEHAGVLGTSSSQIQPQRLIFCETKTGKTSVVRQLEPDVHIDGHSSTLVDLERFIPRLIHVQGGQGEEGKTAAAAALGGSGKIKVARSLREALSALGVVN